MKKGKKKEILILLSFIAIILLIISATLIYSSFQEEKIKGYTGFEKIEDIYNQINNATNNLSLRVIRCLKHDDNGRFLEIRYHFVDIRFIQENNSYLYWGYYEINCYYNEDFEVIPHPFNHYFNDSNNALLNHIDIDKDYLDTDEIYEIALQDKDLEITLNDYSAKDHIHMAFTVSSNESWVFTWENNLGEFSGKSSGGHFNINAVTGKIHDVYIDYGDKDTVAY